MTRIIVSVLITALIAAPAVAATAPAPATDIMRVAVSQAFYADTNAMGARRAYKWALDNASHLMTLGEFVDQGVFVSGGHFFLNSGPFAADITSATVAWFDKSTLPRLPYGLLVQGVYAEGSGNARQLPAFVEVGLRTRFFRIGGALDLSQVVTDGLRVGVMGVVPATDSDFTVKAFGQKVLTATEHHSLDITVGVSYMREWWSLGGTLALTEYDLHAKGIDLTTFQPLDVKQTSSSQLAGLGFAAYPAIPLGLADGSSPWHELARNFQVLADGEYLRINQPDEKSDPFWTGYLGLNFRAVPDAWNPVSSLVRVQGYGGVDTDGGWGAGFGLWPNEHGPLSWLTLDFSYNTRPIASSFGESVDVWSVNAAVTLPSPFPIFGQLFD